MVESTELTLVSTSVPEHVKKSAGLGNENVAGEHLQTPRVKLLQQMSSEVDENHDAYIDGARPGHLLNTVTNENYGQEIYVVNVYFKEDFVVWRKREKGGGIGSSGHKSMSEATEAMLALEGSPEDYEIIQTQTHLLLRKDPETGKLDTTPFLMDFASSKLRVSREWNTQIQQLGGDRFSSLWKIASVPTANRSGQKFHNLSVKKEGWALEEDYDIAKNIYKAVSG